MNSTIRNLIIAAPLATTALTLAPAAAMATEPGPVILAPKPEQPKGPQDKAPAPKPEQPKGPQDKAPAPKPEQPKGPQDKAPAPKPEQPKGPGGITNPEPCPTHGVDCTPDKDGPKGGDEPKGDDGGNDVDTSGEAKNSVEGVVDTVELPNRIDAGVAGDDQDGIDLTWLLAGGAIVTASGAAFAARNRMRRRA